MSVKLTNAQRQEIRRRYARETARSLAVEFGVTIKAIRNAARRGDRKENPNTSSWNCGDKGHLWHADIIMPSRVTECDWCVVCTTPRPGLKDPQEKWDIKDDTGSDVGSSGPGPVA